MDWGAIRPVLKSAVASCLGYTSPADMARVEWKGKKQAAYGRGLGVRVDMSIGAVRGVGNDEQLLEYSGTEDANIVTLSGIRQITWTLRVESDDQDDGTIAQVYADRIRIRLGRESIAATLRAVGVAVADVLLTQPMSYRFQDREHSVVVMDVQLNGVENDRDDSIGAGDWIETINVKSETLYREDGTPANPQLDFNVGPA